MDNPFLRRILDGSITTEDELRSLFRRTAKDLHPDTSPFTRDHDAFTRLSAHYEHALEYMRTAPQAPLPEPASSPSDPVEPVEPVAGTSGNPESDRSLFYFTLQNLVARRYPFTKGREDSDPSLRRHIDEAAKLWDCWQPGEKGLFSQMEALRKEKIGNPRGGNTSDQSVWQAVESFLINACQGGMGQHPPHRNLLEHRSREALLKLGRREGTEAVVHFVGLIMEDLRARIPAGQI